MFYHKDLKQHDERLQTIFNTVLTEFHRYSNCETLSVQLKQNRMVANNLKNALQDCVKTLSVIIKVLRFISWKQQPISSITKCFQSRKYMIKTQFSFTFCFPYFTNRCQNLVSLKMFLYISGPSLLQRAFLCTQFLGQGGKVKLLFNIFAGSA